MFVLIVGLLANSDAVEMKLVLVFLTLVVTIMTIYSCRWSLGAIMYEMLVGYPLFMLMIL